jgi:hypothetical protein
VAEWYGPLVDHFIGANFIIVKPDGKPAATDYDTLAFKLEVKCEKNHHVGKEESDPHIAFKHANGIIHIFIHAHFV